MALELSLQLDGADPNLERCVTRNNLYESLSKNLKRADSMQGRLGVFLKPNLLVSSNGGSDGSRN